jgi:hypothetical protein
LKLDDKYRQNKLQRNLESEPTTVKQKVEVKKPKKKVSKEKKVKQKKEKEK